MSIFVDESIPSVIYDKEALRERVSMSMLVTFLGLEWDQHHQKIKCIRHKGGAERTPSAQVNANTVYCHACAETWDIFKLVMEYRHLNFYEAVKFIAETIDDMPAAKAVEAKPSGSEYLGAADPALVMGWKAELKPEHRTYLHGRLLTDATIDSVGIGWRPEWNAYSIPFWRGRPLQSDIDIVQFRATDRTFWYNNGKGRYLGLKGHNRPSIIGRHTIGYRSMVLFFGTFDALLAEQDDLGAVSINGATTFLRDEEAIQRLSGCLRASRIFIVPDKVASEYPAAYRLAELLKHSQREVIVAHFPEDVEGKDYTEYRQAGKTVHDFLREVLLLKSSFPADNGDLGKIVLMLKHVAAGDLPPMLDVLQELANAGYMSQVINHELQMQASFSPYAGLTHEQWDKLITQLENSLSWEALATCLTYWTKIAELNQGAF